MNEPKYAVIESYSIYHEGDERSRTNPGHGYPAHTETVEKFVPFKDKAELERWVERQIRYESRFKVIEYREMAVKTTTSVEIK